MIWQRSHNELGRDRVIHQLLPQAQSQVEGKQNVVLQTVPTSLVFLAIHLKPRETSAGDTTTRQASNKKNCMAEIWKQSYKKKRRNMQGHYNMAPPLITIRERSLTTKNTFL